MEDNTLGVGLNTLAAAGSHESSFLSVYETEFHADVRRTKLDFVVRKTEANSFPTEANIEESPDRKRVTKSLDVALFAFRLQKTRVGGY